MKVLIVDDSRAQLQLLTRMLGELGYDNVVACSDVNEAKAALDVAPQVQLILSDLNMPGDSGIDFLTYVRCSADLKSVPFVMVTSDHDRGRIVEAAKKGIQAYMIKPVEKASLRAKLRDLAASHGITPPREFP